ncbi:hypothetical protein VPJ68_00750, partial [Parabacteroides distasonis]
IYFHDALTKHRTLHSLHHVLNEKVLRYAFVSGFGIFCLQFFVSQQSVGEPFAFLILENDTY